VKNYPKVIDRILEVIRESKTFCIVGHVRPDGDCIGSQLGLALALQSEGKKVACWNEDVVPQKYKFLNPGGLFQKPKRGRKFDCVIATDCAKLASASPTGKCSSILTITKATRATPTSTGCPRANLPAAS
jgi:phosphoesterase RecJ-like protein